MMDDLTARLDALEFALAGKGDVPTLEMGQTLQDVVAQLASRLQAVVQRHGDLRAVLDGVRQHKVTRAVDEGADAYADVGFVLQQLLLSHGQPPSREASLVLLAASESGTHDTARLLAAVHAHTQYLNPETLDALQPQQQRLARLQATHVAQKEQAVWLNTQVDGLLLAYHDIVFAVSSQLLRCDALLEQLEARRKRNSNDNHNNGNNDDKKADAVHSGEGQ